MTQGTVLIVGGTSGLGRRLAEVYAQRGREVVISGREQARAEAVAADIGGQTRGVALDLADPKSIAPGLSGTEPIGHVVLAAIERDHNTLREFDIEGATRLATLKLVGFAEVLHRVHERMGADSSVLLFGGLAKERPYPGSTIVTSVNGAVTTMVRTFALELAPVRVNAIHPGIVGDSPAWKDNADMLERVISRTPTGRLVTMDDVTDACLFLLENASVNGINLSVDGGWLMG